MYIRSTQRLQPATTRAVTSSPVEQNSPESESGEDKLELGEYALGGAVAGGLLLATPLMLCGFTSGVAETLMNTGLSHQGAMWAGLAATGAVGALSGAAGGVAYANTVMGNPEPALHEKVTEESFGEPLPVVMASAASGALLAVTGTYGLPVVGLATGALLSKNKKLGAGLGLLAGAGVAAAAWGLGGGATVGGLLNATTSLMVGGATAGACRALSMNLAQAEAEGLPASTS